MAPTRRQPVDPLMQTVIENNLLLGQALESLKEIGEKQDTNHIITLALREHKTIERVDELWSATEKIEAVAKAQGKAVGRQVQVFLGIPAFAVAVVAVLTFCHAVLQWF